MKVSKQVISILIFLFSTKTYCQALDSIIYIKNKIRKENPRIKSLDSLRQKFDKSLIKLSADGYSVSTKKYEMPILYYYQNDNLEIEFEKHISERLRETKNKFKADFEIEIDWNGEINFIKLKKYRGDINNIDFADLFRGVKAYPATEFCIPVKHLINIPISKN